jgi:hypothetical protein
VKIFKAETESEKLKGFDKVLKRSGLVNVSSSREDKGQLDFYIDFERIGNFEIKSVFFLLFFLSFRF